MTSASGFTWVAREPRLMVGAKMRASSRISIDYHNLPQIQQLQLRQSQGTFGLLRNRAGQVIPLTRSCSCNFRCGRGQFGTTIPSFRRKFRPSRQNYRSGDLRLCNCRSARCMLECIGIVKGALAPQAEPSCFSFHEGPKQSVTAWCRGGRPR